MHKQKCCETSNVNIKLNFEENKKNIIYSIIFSSLYFIISFGFYRELLSRILTHISQ